MSNGFLSTLLEEDVREDINARKRGEPAGGAGSNIGGSRANYGGAGPSGRLRQGVGGVVDLLACNVTSAKNSDTSNLNVLWGMGVVKPILVECNAMHVESPVILLVIARTRVQANSREIRSRGEQ